MQRIMLTFIKKKKKKKIDNKKYFFNFLIIKNTKISKNNNLRS